MKEFVVAKGLHPDELDLMKCEANNIDDAKLKYANYMWENDEIFLKDVNSREINYSFWHKYGNGLKDYNCVGIDSVDKFLKNNFRKDFSEDVVNELMDVLFYNKFDPDKNISDLLSEKAKMEIAKVQMERRFKNNYLRIYDLEKSKPYKL